MSAPALSLALPPEPTGLAGLDLPEEWQRFSRACPGRPGLWESGLSIEGMHCAACGPAVEAALLAVPGVVSARVGVASGRARVVWAPGEVQPSRWLASVQRAGYRPWPLADMDGDSLRRSQRQALWRWLVAGFCMMQVMMYSVPGYMAAPGDMTPDMEQLMRWASWVLTLPVVFFSCGPFFGAATRDLVRGRISMDLPVALGIAITFAASTAATFDAHSTWAREVWFDSLTMFVFFLLTGRWLEARLRGRTAGALAALMRRLPATADCRQADGSFKRVPLRQLAAGDVVRVRAGEAFPGDGVLIRGSTQVDEALLTGESRPIARQTGQAVLAASHNLSGLVELRITQAGADTRYAEIVALMEAAAMDKPRLALLADRVAAPFLAAVLLVAMAAAAWWWPVDPARALTAAVAVLVVTCPCALSLAAPAAMLASAGALARRGVLLKNLNALEALAHVDTVVFDKTGTLTNDGLTVGDAQVQPEADASLVAALAGTLARASLHPASRAVAAWAGGTSRLLHAMQDVEEVRGQGVQGRWAGQTYRLGSASFCGDGSDAGAGELTQVCLFGPDGLMARFALREALRPEAVAVVSQLQAMGLQVSVASGDRVESVARVAARLGGVPAQGGCSVQDKLLMVQGLQAQGRRVLMVGDGLNDGPVLACADVSVAVGSAVPMAQRQADCVMVSGDLRAISALVEQGRRTLRVVHQNLAWAALYNALCVPLAVSGWLPAWLAGIGMALSSMLVVLNAARLSRTDGAA